MKIITSVIFSVSSFVALIFMTRYVGEAYGMMMWGMSLVATFNSALDLGFNLANIKKVSEGKDLNRCVSTYLAIRIVLSSLTTGLVLITALLMNYFNGGFPGVFYGELAVGAYTAAAGIISSVVSLGTVMNSLLLSHMIRLRAERKEEEMRKTLWAAQKYLAMLMLPAAVFLLMFGNETVVALFGNDFVASGPILSVLAISIYLVVLNGMFSQILISMGRTVSYGKSATFYAVLTLVLFFVLIPGNYFDAVSGGVGAAAAIVIGCLVFVILLLMTIRRLGAPGLYPKIYIHIAAAVVLAMLLYIVKICLEPSGIPYLAMLSLFSAGIYFVIVVATREITKKDVDFIRDTFSPKGIYNDLLSEMKKN
jgi:O-antigen/teichoic acid export membrane protein